jgi:hypothetical protein
MPKLTLDDQLSLWGERITRGRRFRWEQSEKNWDRIVKFLLGEQWSESDPGYDAVAYHAVKNLCWRIIRAYLPALYFNDPHVMVRVEPMDDTAQQQLEDWEKWIGGRANLMLRTAALKKKVREVIPDSLIFPFGWLKLGWMGLDQESYDAITYPNKPQNLSVYAERVSPWDMVIDSVAKNKDSVRWMAEHIVRPYLDVIEDARYDSRALKEVRPSLWPSESGKDGQDNQKPEVAGVNPTQIEEIEGYVSIWEVMTMEDGGRLLTFVEDEAAENDSSANKTTTLTHLLRDEALPYAYLNHFPYYPLCFNDVPDALYPPSDLELIKEMQLEANYVRSLHLEQVRTYKNLHIYDRGAAGPEFEARIANAPNNALIGVDGILQMQSLQTPPTPADVIYTEQSIERDAWETAGVDQAMAQGSTKGESATAVSQRGQFSGIRMADRANVMKEYLEQVVNDALLIWLHEDQPDNTYRVMVDQASGEQQQVAFPVSELLDKRFQVVLETQSTFPINRQVEIQQFLSAVNLIANNPAVNPRELAHRTLELFEVRGIDKILPPGPIGQLTVMMERNPQLAQVVMQFVQQLQAQAQAAQGGGQPSGPPQGRVMADVNAEAPRPGNAGTDSAAQGGA